MSRSCRNVRARIDLVAALVVAAFVVVISAAPSAAAAPLRVCANGCPYSTIEAALAASSNGDKIMIARGTYAGGISITKSVTLQGAGAEETTISLSGSLGAGIVVAVAVDTSVTISGVTITGGFARLGAGVNNAGTLTLRDSVVTGNNGFGFGSAGTIYNSSSGVMTLSNTTVADNIVVDGVGGGIYNLGSTLLKNSVVTGNGSEFVGAGLYNDVGATMTLRNSRVSDNASGQSAGGIENRGTLTLKESSISGNSAQIAGGGILNEGTVAVDDSSVSGNTAGWGGGIYNSGSALLRESTVSGNTAQFQGGGIFNLGVATFSESTVSGNTPDDCFGC